MREKTTQCNIFICKTCDLLLMICLGLFLYIAQGHCDQEGKNVPLAKLIKIAEEGDGPAQIRLGTAYLEGNIGAELDRVKAVYWFSQAAKQGLPVAQYNLGLCYEKGLGVETDMNHALVLYQSAADQGIIRAQLRAGLVYQRLEKNEDAVKYFRLAAGKGNIAAQREYGRMLLYGKGVESDPREAVNILQRIAEKGDNEARLILAESYTGTIPGTHLNLKRMLEYLWEGASQNAAEAQSKLGYCYEEGIGVPRDTGLAVKWYEKAAMQNYPQALVNLGHCYTNGRGTAMDKEKAFTLYKKAAELDFPPGMYNLGVCYAKGFGVKKDEVKAETTLLKAAELGDANAEYALGVLYENGLGRIAPDRSKALYWYRKTADRKDPRALRAITFLNLQEVNTLGAHKAGQQKKIAETQNNRSSGSVENPFSILDPHF